jgi:hypothetical protein
MKNTLVIIFVFTIALGAFYFLPEKSEQKNYFPGAIEFLDSQWINEEKSTSEIRTLFANLEDKEVKNVLIKANKDNPFIFDFLENSRDFQSDIQIFFFLKSVEKFSVSEIEAMVDLMNFDGLVLETLPDREMLQLLDKQLEKEKIILLLEATNDPPRLQQYR